MGFWRNDLQVYVTIVLHAVLDRFQKSALQGQKSYEGPVPKESRYLGTKNVYDSWRLRFQSIEVETLFAPLEIIFAS